MGDVASETIKPHPGKIIYGPPGTTPGGSWFQDPKAKDKDCAEAIFCCVVCCQCDILLTYFCPPVDKSDFAYLDPIKKVLISSTGSQVPKSRFGTQVSPEQLQVLQDKYRPYRPSSSTKAPPQEQPRVGGNSMQRN